MARQYTVTTPEGTNIHFTGPDNATDEQLVAFAQKQQANGHLTPSDKQTGADDAPKAAPHSLGKTIVDGAGSIATNALFGLGDELAGAGGAVGNVLGAVAGGIKTGSAKAAWQAMNPGEAYSTEKQNFLDDQKVYHRDHPDAATATDVAGMVGGAFLPVGKVVGGAGKALELGASPARAAVAKAIQKVGTFGHVDKEAGVIARVAGGAKQGAAGAAAYGFGSTDGDLEDRAIGAINNAPLGAVIGGAIPAAMGAARGAGRFLADNAGAEAQAAAGQRRAVDALSGDLEASGLTPDQLADRHAYQTGELGVPVTPGDMSDPLRSRLVGETASMGAARAKIVDDLGVRQGNQSARMQGHIDRDLGDIVEPEAHLQGLKDARQAAADADYTDMAAQPPVDMTEHVQNTIQNNPLLGRALNEGEQAVGHADTSNLPWQQKVTDPGQVHQPGSPAVPDRQAPSSIMGPDGKPIMRTIPGTPEVPGGLQPGAVPKWKVISAANAALNKMAKYGESYHADVGEQGIVNGARQQARNLQELFPSPAWEKARAGYADGSQKIRAFEGGQGSYGADADGINAATQGMDADKLGQFKLGYTSQLAAKAKGTKFFGDVPQGIMGSAKQAEATNNLFAKAGGRPSDLGRFQNAIDAERSTNVTYKRVANAQSQMEPGASGAGTARRLFAAAAYLKTGGVVSAMREVGNILGESLGKANSEAYKTAVAKALTEGDTTQVRALMDTIKASRVQKAKVLATLAARANYAGRFAGTAVGGATLADQRSKPSQSAQDDQ